ncbi:MAG: NIPSNAP family protein [Bryobacterales bacterium]|nr:NIPSNAP family protein [Bryobacterales bacterium]
MDRRNFLATSSAAGLASESAAAAGKMDGENQIFELRCYKLRYSKSDQYGRLTEFLEAEHLPMTERLGLVQGYFRVTLGEFTPRVYTLAAYDSLADMGEKLAAKRADKEWGRAVAAFGSQDQPPYDRVESWLLRAFDGMKRVEVPPLPDSGRAFDLRIYEQETARDTQEKMRMFNEGEIRIFRDCGIHPLFFGETIVGSHMPSLVYMSHYASMDARGKAWSAFVKSEGWNRIKQTPGWSNAEIVSTVSNIHLAGLPFSPIR